MELVLRDVTTTYGDSVALSNVSFRVSPGQIVAVVGPNGSGKSTLIKTIATILKARSGTITIDESDIYQIDPIDLASRIGYVPQQYTYTLYSTVFETVLLGRRPYIKWTVSEEELSRVQQALEDVDMEGSAGRFMDQLSGGERQKVFIARALAQDPALYLFDEPTSALDIRHQLGVMETLKKITMKGAASVVIALHDLNLAFRYADTVMILQNGAVAGIGRPKDVLDPDCIRAVYGVEIRIVENEFGQFLLPIRQSL
ncbi:MAG: ABC transporter ATP-binding protein [Methanoregula sp.]|jgi:iron complex transport system ATP-binding protein|nr:ABC transporter ATP-binding protein [Methanoregula sp.]